MSKIVIIAGKSATGKTTAYAPINNTKRKIEITGLPPKETFIINVADKELGTIGLKKTYSDLGHITNASTYANIYKVIESIKPKIKSKEIRNLIIEDAQYLLAFDFFNRKDEKGFEKFSKMGFSFINLVITLRKMFPDLKVYLLMHTQDNEEGVEVGLKTIGKMLDEKFVPQGLFTTVLVAQKKFDRVTKELKYSFRTRPNTEEDIAKSPIGMFDDKETPNDMAIVSAALDLL